MSHPPPRYGEFLPDQSIADHIQHALGDLCMARDHGRHPYRAYQLKTIVKQLETLRDQYRSEHHT